MQSVHKILLLAILYNATTSVFYRTLCDFRLGRSMTLSWTKLLRDSKSHVRYSLAWLEIYNII